MKTETKLEALRKTRYLIEDEDRWCGDQPIGRRVEGGVVVSRCLVAALGTVTGDTNDFFWEIIEDLEEVGGITSSFALVRWNDTHTHCEVLSLVDSLIERYELSLPGKSKTVTVEPLKAPAPTKEPTPAPVTVPEREKVPA